MRITFLYNTRVILTALCLFLHRNAAAQDVPKVIQPSPEASALFRFHDYPMDYSTGLPSISIPLYEVKSGSLSVPITLGYHASGRRVSDQDGPIALGWSLDAGGIISRTVYGSPDFGTPTNGTYYFPYPFRTTNLSNASDYQYFEKIMHYNNVDANNVVLPWTESEYDVFSYNFGGNGGKFIFKDDNNVKTAVLLPYKPYIVTPFYSFRGLDRIDITDDKGVYYKFGQPESAGPDGDYPVTSLSLTQMISADKADTINFIYTGFAQWNSSFNQVRTYIDKADMNNTANDPSYPQGQLTNTESPSYGVWQIRRLTEIDFRQGKVLFNLVTGSDKIDNIQVKDINNNVIKTIQLNRSLMDGLNQGGSSYNPNYSQVNNKLDAIIFKDKAGSAVENYGFEYYPTKYFGSETFIDSHYTDWWGYYNASGFINMIPDYNLPNSTGLGTDHVGGSDWNREPDLEALKSGVLKKITYPTGGNTIFTYENNRYGDPSNSGGRNGPGLRVAQTTATDNNGSTIVKTYKYGVGEVGYGSLDLAPSIYTMASHQNYYFFGASGLVPGDGGSYGLYTFNSGFNSELSALAGRPIIYSQVTEYNGTTDHNIGKTVYDYDYYGWAPSGMPAYGIQLIAKKHVYNWNYWNNPSPLTKTDYLNTASSSAAPAYTIRKRVDNHYTINNIDDVVGLHVQRLQVWPQIGLVGNPSRYIEQYFMAGAFFNMSFDEGRNIYTFSDYHIPVGIKTLASTAETVYNDDGSTVTNTTAFDYNTRYYVSQKTQNTSDGASLIQHITYPFDYSGNTGLAQMIAPPLNMQNFPIEQSEFKNSAPLKSVRTNYLNWGTTQVPAFRPQIVDVNKGTNAYETRLHFFGYDSKGNPTSLSKDKDVLLNYIWDYQQAYPTAEVKNAGQNDIAYTSFEAEGGGNWVIGSSLRTTTDAITGKQSYDLNGGLSKANLSSGTTYILSYWAKGGSRSISGATIVSTKTGRSTAGGWTYYETTLTSTSSSISITGSGLIDELRLYPKDAQMTSYTYDPLVGQTSASDARGEITYSVYDNYGRLKLIKDTDGNILKTFNYQYKSTTP